ncbi:MAG: M42 family metallopeptidase [Promethearchaeota archaeon]
MKNIDLLKRLVEADGPPGFEEEVRLVMIEELKDYVDSIEVDVLGNVIMKKEGTNDENRLMLDAHTDEIALMVRYIDENGFIYFDKHGWVDDRILLSQWVKVHGEAVKVRGVIGIKSAHLVSQEEAQKTIPATEMWIDVGVSSREEVLEKGIEAGAPITFDRSFCDLGNGYVCAKAVDDRVGCFALIETMKELANDQFDFSIYAVGSSQEEIGARGAKTAAYAINPQAALMLDTTHATDATLTRRKGAPTELGKGPAIRFMDRLRTGFTGILTPRVMRDLLVNAAKQNNIPYQIDVSAFTWTNASTIHLARSGVSTGSLLIPRRYGHSPSEVTNLNDLQNAIRLLTAAVRKIDSTFFGELKKKIQ